MSLDKVQYGAVIDFAVGIEGSQELLQADSSGHAVCKEDAVVSAHFGIHVL